MTKEFSYLSLFQVELTGGTGHRSVLRWRTFEKTEDRSLRRDRPLRTMCRRTLVHVRRDTFSSRLGFDGNVGVFHRRELRENVGVERRLFRPSRTILRLFSLIGPRFSDAVRLLDLLRRLSIEISSRQQIFLSDRQSVATSRNFVRKKSLWLFRFLLFGTDDDSFDRLFNDDGILSLGQVQFRNDSISFVILKFSQTIATILLRTRSKAKSTSARH